MTNSIKSFAAAAIAAVAFVSAAAADEAPKPGAVYGAGTVGAMYWETRGVATQGGDVRGGATAATVRWLPAPEQSAKATGVGTVGALYYETVGLATDASAVQRQGGAASASTVRWTAGSAKGS